MHRSAYSAQPECGLHQGISFAVPGRGRSHRGVERYVFRPDLVPAKPTIRDFGTKAEAVGEAKYYYNRYLKKRGHANIKDLTDLINKSRYYVDTFGRDTRFRDVKSVLEDANKPSTLDVRDRDANRSAIQQTVMQCTAILNLEAVAYPTGNVPALLIKGNVIGSRLSILNFRAPQTI